MQAPCEETYFDARWLGDHGIGRFAREVMRRLKPPRILHAVSCPTSPLDVLYLTWKVLSAGPFLWYSPGYNAPLFGLGRYVFTVHDLNHLDNPSNSTLFKRLYYRLVLRRACRGAARVLTVSEYSRQRIAEWSGVDPARVVNVGNGVAAAFSPDVAPHQPGYRYLLCVGNRKGHKNERRVLEAFAACGIDSAIRLVFTGNPSEELQAAALSLGVAQRTVFLGRVAERELPGIYRGALALVFPSLYEGFGLPVVEAMACGTPVVTSNVTSLPEVAGDAALLVDPTDVGAIAAAIARVVQDDSLRCELAEKGLQRAASFSWDAVAARVQAVLQDVTAERRGAL